jgi:hypothetical protein
MICSMPDWDNPSREHPVWDRPRLERTVIELLARDVLTGEGVVDPIVDLDEAPEAFMSIYRDPARSVKLGIRFGPRS